MRRCRVLRPISVNQQSNGLGTAPMVFWMNLSSSKMSSRLVITAPPMIWLWPLRYLVVECMTMSAPNSSGRRNTGVAKVESTPR